jgi:hypothetical protein
MLTVLFAIVAFAIVIVAIVIVMPAWLFFGLNESRREKLIDRSPSASAEELDGVDAERIGNSLANPKEPD